VDGSYLSNIDMLERFELLNDSVQGWRQKLTALRGQIQIRQPGKHEKGLVVEILTWHYLHLFGCC